MQSSNVACAQGAGAAARAPEDDRPTLLCAAKFAADGFLRLRGRRLTARAAAPLPSLFWAAGLSFSRAELFLQACAQITKCLASTTPCVGCEIQTLCA